MNKANEILSMLGVATGWSKEPIPSPGAYIGPQRLDKEHAEAAGVSPGQRRYERRYMHVLSRRVTDKNLAVMANRKAMAAQ